MRKNDIEEQLLKKAIAGDPVAFAKLVQQHEQSLFLHAYFLSKNEKDAEDILQEALLKAFLYIKNFQGKSSFKTWLWTIVRNEFYNFKTSKKTPGNDLYIDDFVEIGNKKSKTQEDNLILEDKKATLKNLINQLSSKYKEVIILVDLQEKTYDEVSEILEISIPALKSRLFRAREKLAEIVLKNKKYF